ncbi:MAG: glycerophosphodiester phosphodiesterase [Acidobacteria bacterium]|nr:glycerophosphodiester phosphodiesterase [Acidobacteriota bacterium]
MAAGRGFDHPFFAGGKHPDVIAHRGGNGQWPGETVYAFEQARRLKVDVIEMDVRRTGDGELVLMHNSNIKETTGVDKELSKLTAREVTALPATHGWPDAGDFPPEKVRVPTLKEVLERFSDLRMNVEIKERDLPDESVEKFCNLIKDHGLAEKVLIASLWHGVLSKVRKLLPKAATSASGVQMAEFRALNHLLHLKSNKVETNALQISSRYGPITFITGKYVERAHHAGLPVHGWTVNDPKEMGRLIEIGVDGIITDYPSTLLELLGRPPQASDNL